MLTLNPFAASASAAVSPAMPAPEMMMCLAGMVVMGLERRRQTPPSGLPAISPTRGEIDEEFRFRQSLMLQD
ncbi:hypothetical protein GCM10011491_20420 [Brucella endophytica]|uniref:Uncharacterized protein n=1 Tax=Brucella endophytica TaxID=1963359 RepID=A0A916WEN2_9HYPH|nr:hypothetical protein GCM10011491_20420 [Brucella endophytica]